MLIIVASYLMVNGAGNYHYSEDEALHIGIAQADSPGNAVRFSLYEAHPPLGHILRYFWMKISDNIGFVRGLSLLFAVAVIPLYYRIGKLLGGDLTGMCCAALAAFSYGLIVQSFVARNYSMFIFFISAVMYSYLLWNNSRRPLHLHLYVLMALLAIMTHFAAILALFPIAAYQSVTMLRQKAAPSQQLSWVVHNVVLAAVALGIYYFWANNGVVLGGRFFATASSGEFVLAVLVNPIKVAEYLFPSEELIPPVIFLLFLPMVSEDKKLRQFLLLAGFALLLGMGLVATNRYYPAGTRHGVWVMPFLIPAAGWMIAKGLNELAVILNRKRPAPWLHILMAVIVILGMATYDPARRFAEKSEYQMTEEQWHQTSNYLEKLPHSSLLVAARDDAIMLMNLYPYLGSDAFSGKVAAAIVPYRDTHILFNPYNRRMVTKKVLLDTLNEAGRRHMLDGIDILVFMKTDWDVFEEPAPPLPYLISCPDLRKRIISFPAFSFPPLPPDAYVSEEEKKITPVAFMEVSKKDFFEQVIAENGIAHHCLGRAE